MAASVEPIHDGRTVMNGPPRDWLYFGPDDWSGWVESATARKEADPYGMTTQKGNGKSKGSAARWQVGCWVWAP